jgi:hypothetical protein
VTVEKRSAEEWESKWKNGARSCKEWGDDLSKVN